MKILLVTLDSKFIHANLAVRYLKKYCSNFDIEIKEFTINQKLEYILGEIIAVAVKPYDTPRQQPADSSV